MKFSIKDFFSKFGQQFPADLVTFTDEILMENFIFVQCFLLSQKLRVKCLHLSSP